MTLAAAPIELHGDWGDSLPASALLVISRMREASLAGGRLVSDRQPDRLRVDNHGSGPPHIWLHSDGLPVAWIIVDIGERDWSRLAYQFGHEFGHVLCNSWGRRRGRAIPASGSGPEGSESRAHGQSGWASPLVINASLTSQVAAIQV